jgi:hypothetical protein
MRFLRACGSLIALDKGARKAIDQATDVGDLDTADLFTETSLAEVLGRPVLTGNQVVFWYALRLAGVGAKSPTAARRSGNSQTGNRRSK